ncbi:MAG: acetyl-CoA synthase subunit gamma [Phycisphaerae bacterium]|nr:acetyl-CoA synthase subunit gamma [Phycisphaerae bacterium]
MQSNWTWQDRLGAVAVRCAFRRMRYAVTPGLYAVNDPGADSLVFVSANYKLSFDHLRCSLTGISGWILVLDTKGINVWCAAGKGTFGTEEPVRRVDAVNLKDVVTHRQLIVPQLGAPGLAAHDVAKQCRFHIVYGPVRACDIARFLEAGLKADPAMRRVQFPLRDRLAVVPVEMIGSVGKAAALAGLFGVLAIHRSGTWSWQGLYPEGVTAAGLVFLAYLFVSVIVPAGLPWLPGRAFSLKGACAGLLGWALLWATGLYGRASELMAWCMLFMVMGSFMGLNFTGASTYTSLSGVKKETRLAVPMMAVGLLLSLGLWIRACGIL